MSANCLSKKNVLKPPTKSDLIFEREQSGKKYMESLSSAYHYYQEKQLTRLFSWWHEPHHMSGHMAPFPIRLSYSLNYLKPHDEIHNKKC